MACKLCGGRLDKIELLCRNLKIMGEHFPKSEVYLSVCEKCGLVQYDMNVSQNDLLEYYVSSAMPFQYKNVNEVTSEYFFHLYSAVKDYITTESYILDVGGGYGEFAEYMRRRGYKNIYVADPASQCIDRIIDNGGKGVKVDSTSMLKEQFPNQFDLIFYNHTLEHIYDLTSTMEKTLNLLKDDGSMFIEVPNAEKYLASPMTPYYFLTYEHVLHFGENDLYNLADRYGLKMISDVQCYDKKSSCYPCCFVLYRKGGIAKEVKYSDKTVKALKEYLEYCHVKLKDMTEKFRNTQEPLILWGIGASTEQLLQGFDGCNVIQLIDKNPRRQNIEYTVSGKELVIQEPKMIVNNATIVILPYMYAESIKKQIVEMGILNRVVSLCFEA